MRTTDRPPHLRPILLLATALLPFSACAGTGPADIAGKCEVGVIGDSLTVGAREFGDLQAKLERSGCTVTEIDARPGRPTVEGADIAESLAVGGRMPEILVVALGSNDCDPSQFEPAASRILAAAGSIPVMWVNIWRSDCDGPINEIIDSLASDRNSEAGSKTTWVLDHHAWVEDNPGVLSADGVHLTDSGYQQYADRMVGGVHDG